MTIVKINGALSSAADAALESQKEKLFANRSARIMIVAELKHLIRNQPGVDEDKEDEVKLRFTFLEAAQTPQQDEHLRKAMEALKLQRTAYGTLDQELEQVRVSKSILEDCAGDLALTEMARQRAVLVHIQQVLDRLVNGVWTERQLRDQIRKLNRVALGALNFDPAPKGEPAPAATSETNAEPKAPRKRAARTAAAQ